MFDPWGVQVKVVDAGTEVVGADGDPIVIDDGNYAMGGSEIVCTARTRDAIIRAIQAQPKTPRIDFASSTAIG